MKKLISAALAALFAIFTLAACSSGGAQSAPAGQKLSVVATIFPQYDFVRQIAGDKVDLTMLLRPGSESHSYEPTPQDILAIQNCDVFIHVGGENDAWVESILASMDTGSRKVLTLMEMVQPVEEKVVEGMEDEEEHDHDAEEHDTEEVEYDEHVWTSPKNAKLIVQGISEALCAADTANADAYQANTESYLAELDELDTAFQNAVEGGSRKTVVFGDRFPFRYLADAYGLTYFAAFPGCSTETEPSAATVAFLIDKVNGEHIPVVFHTELSSEKMADTICEATGAKKLLLHACHNISADDFANGATYLGLMTQNAAALREALG